MNKPTYDFLEHLKVDRNYSDTTIKSYQSDIEKFTNFIINEGVLYDQVDIIVIRNFLTEELNAGISKRSCKRRLSTLKQFYAFMVDTKVVKDNPFIFVNSPKTDKKLPDVLYKDQVQEIMKRNAERTDDWAIRDQAILSMLYYCGLRASELVNLKVQDVNLRGRYVRVMGKGNKERIVPFTEECRDAVQKYIDTDRKKLLEYQKQPNSHLFLSQSRYSEKDAERYVEHNLDKKMTTRNLE